MKSYTDENGNLIWYKDSDEIFAKLENLNTECNSYTVAETRYQEVLKEHDDKIRADERAKQNEFFNFDEVIKIECEKARADEREKVLDEVIKTLAKSEDTMLSDKQYYTLMELKEKK